MEWLKGLSPYFGTACEYNIKWMTRLDLNWIKENYIKQYEILQNKVK